MTTRAVPAPVTGLLLAGGDSRRMGRDKALLEVRGAPLAVHALAVLDEVAAEVLVASGDGRRLAALGRAQVADAVTGGGPLAGIVAGLEAARTELVAVLAVDMPDASAAVFATLRDAWAGERAVVPRAAGRLQPLHALWARAAAPALRARLDAGLRSVTAAAEALGARIVDVADPGFARNLNAPDDLA